MTELLHAFANLAISIADKVQQHKSKENGDIERIEHEYRPVKDLDERHIIDLKFTLDRENFRRYFSYEWEVLALRNFIENEVEKTKEYTRSIKFLTQHLEPIRKIPPDRYRHIVRGLLNQFIIFLCERTVEDNFDFQLLKYFSKVFANDLTQGSSITFKATVYLVNFSLEEPLLKLTPDMELRKIRQTELAISTRDFYESTWEKLGGKSTNVLTALDTSIELQVSTSLDLDREARQQLCDKLRPILNALRLFSTSQVFDASISFNAETILFRHFNGVVPSPLSKNHQLGQNTSRFSELHCRIEKGDAQKLQRFVNNLSPRLEQINESSYYNGAPIEIAFHRYLDAVLRSHNTIVQLSYSIYVLDALFVHDNETKNSGAKLLIRSSRLLSWVTNEGMGDINRKLKLAYRIRSKLVHGGQLSKGEETFIEEETESILNYSRIALICFLQVQKNADKKCVLNLTDQAQKEKGMKKHFLQLTDELLGLS